MITGLHHAQITIPSGMEPEARQFYVALLGLAEIEKPQSLRARGGFWMRVGDREVHVGTEDGVDRTRTKAHLAYQVRGLGEWRRRLAAAGVGIDDSVPLPGYERFEFRDPFGNRVELIEPTVEQATPEQEKQQP
jgi:catechol 2,3-dioxygenase-like lactoylglutathione lyase family enzyme